MTEPMASQRDLVAAERRIDGRIDGHEDLCTERYSTIVKRLDNGDQAREAMRAEIKSSFSGVYTRLWAAGGGLVSLLIAIIFLLVQLLRAVPT